MRLGPQVETSELVSRLHYDPVITMNDKFLSYLGSTISNMVSRPKSRLLQI